MKLLKAYLDRGDETIMRLAITIESWRRESMASLIWLIVWLVQGTPEPRVVRLLERLGGCAARLRHLRPA